VWFCPWLDDGDGAYWNGYGPLNGHGYTVAAEWPRNGSFAAGCVEIR
jgi:hypothetical protein